MSFDPNQPIACTDISMTFLEGGEGGTRLGGEGSNFTESGAKGGEGAGNFAPIARSRVRDLTFAF